MLNMLLLYIKLSMNNNEQASLKEKANKMDKVDNHIEKINKEEDFNSKAVTIAQFNIEEKLYDFEDDKNEHLKQIFMGTLFTIILLIISVSYGVTWSVLFIIYIDLELPAECDSIKSWDKVLIVVSFISAGLHIISSVIQLIGSAQDVDSNIAKYITTIRSCINCLSGIVLLLAINIEYYSLDNPSICEELATLNLVYIIVEWCLVGFFICFVVVLCVFAMITKKMKNQLQ
jgi:hypothetical protein